MTKVFFDIAISLDGFMAGPNRGPHNPLGDGGVSMHQWMFRTAFGRERLGIPGDGGETSADNELLRGVFERTGAYIMGRRMFDEGEANWPENAPFRAPVFVLTHQPRDPWVRKGGTTFYFVTEGIERTLELARAAANGKDVRVSGGGEAIRQYLHAGLVDEFTLHIAPVLLGTGVRALDGPRPATFGIEQSAIASSPHVAHVSYRVKRQ
ncbi:MAG TPA: dihydrofolate reductase family protein [Gemmatimonadaceae bacterium]